MTEAVHAHHFDLGDLQRIGSRTLWIPQLGVELRDQLCGSLVVHRPQRGQGAARACPDRQAREPQCGALITGCGLTGAKSQQLQGRVAIRDLLLAGCLLLPA